MGRLEDLERLQKLKESNLLTSEEFEQEKKRILNSTNKKGSTKRDDKMISIGLALGMYSIMFIIISFYINLGIFWIDLLVSVILSAVSLLINIKNKKQLCENNLLTTLGITFSIIAIVLLLPLIVNFFTYFNLYF